MNNCELYHHGILGQKWGVRRFQNKDGSLTSAGKKRRAERSLDSPTSQNHEDYNRAHSPKSVAEMSDAELRSRLNRLQMEQQYSSLMTKSASVSRGKKYIDGVIKAGTTVAAVTSTALTIYNNFDKIKDIVKRKCGG